MGAPTRDGLLTPVTGQDEALHAHSEPWASSEETAARMRAQLRRDTQPEIALRRKLHALGLRYRVNHPLPGIPRRRADLLFASSRVVVFVDGCFWHGCPQHGHIPKVNSWYWPDKIERNRLRDRDTDERLRALGWQSLRIWEHEVSQNAAARVAAAVRGRTVTKPAVRRSGAGSGLEPGGLRLESPGDPRGCSIGHATHEAACESADVMGSLPWRE